MARNAKNDGGATATVEAPAMTKAERQKAANAKAIAKKKARLAALIFYPGLKAEVKVNKSGVDELTPTVKLTEAPTDFDHEKHRPLEPLNFATRAAWYEYSATMYERKAKEARQKAADIKSGKTREPSAKKFDLLQKRFDDLAAILGPELAKDGIDVAVLREKIAAMAKDAAAKDAAATTSNGSGASS